MHEVEVVEKSYKTIPFEIGSIDEATRTFEAVASDTTIDRHGESIDQDGWDLKNFVKNPVILLNHDYWDLPIAQAKKIGFDKDGRLVFKLQFATADEYDKADTVWKLYKGGYMRAFSVGFIPLDAVYDQKKGVYTYTQMELLEISAVTVPSNPNALALAYKEGIIDESEKKQLIATHKSIIKSLTEVTTVKQDESNDEDEEVSKELLEAIEGLTSTVKELGEKVAELKPSEQAESTTLDADKQKEPAEEKADPDKPADENEAGGAEKDDAEVSDEEAQKIIDETVAKALAEAKGQVD